jgi:hypothetical protein
MIVDSQTGRTSGHSCGGSSGQITDFEAQAVLFGVSQPLRYRKIRPQQGHSCILNRAIAHIKLGTSEIMSESVANIQQLPYGGHISSGQSEGGGPVGAAVCHACSAEVLSRTLCQRDERIKHCGAFIFVRVPEHVTEKNWKQMRHYAYNLQLSCC